MMVDNKFACCVECEKTILSMKLIHHEWYSKRYGYRIPGLICEDCFNDSPPFYEDARRKQEKSVL